MEHARTSQYYQASHSWFWNFPVSDAMDQGGGWHGREAAGKAGCGMTDGHDGEPSQTMGESCSVRHHSFQKQSLQYGGQAGRNGQREGKDVHACGRYDRSPSSRCKWYTYSTPGLAARRMQWEPSIWYAIRDTYGGWMRRKIGRAHV